MKRPFRVPTDEEIKRVNWCPYTLVAWIIDPDWGNENLLHTNPSSIKIGNYVYNPRSLWVFDRQSICHPPLIHPEHPEWTMPELFDLIELVELAS